MRRMHLIPGLVLMLLLNLNTPARAQNVDRLSGTWRIVSFVTENVDTGERRNNLGDRPQGFVVFTPERRFIVLVTPAGRASPTSDAERAQAFINMVSYSGPYTIDGNELVVVVDLAWQPSLVGTRLVRYFALEGERLIVTSAPGPSLTAGFARARSIVTWERVQ